MNNTIPLDTITDYAQSFITHWIDDDDPMDQKMAAEAQIELDAAVLSVRKAIAGRAELVAALRMAEGALASCGDNGNEACAAIAKHIRATLAKVSP